MASSNTMHTLFIDATPSFYVNNNVKFQAAPMSNKLSFPRVKSCRKCKETNTPRWRRGPDGNLSLCNACGLHFAIIVRKEKERSYKPKSTIHISELVNDNERELKMPWGFVTKEDLNNRK